MPDYDEMSPKALEKAATKADDPEELVSIAAAFLGHGNTERAIALCERANAIRPTERAFWMIGELARGDRRHADAAAAFRAAVEIDPYAEDDWRLLAGELRSLERWPEAATAVARALELAPMSKYARETAALVALAQRDLPTAWRHWAVIVATGDTDVAADVEAALAPHSDDSRVARARALVAVSHEFVRLPRERKNEMRERAVELADGTSEAAQLALAWALLDHPTRSDEATAVIQRLVARDNREAHCLFGYLCTRGQGVATDDALARHHHGIAAERGVADSEFELSIFYAKGMGGRIDTPSARMWEQRAADHGHGRACLNIAAWAATGAHGPIDNDRAIAYYKRAAATGYADAAQRLAVMYGSGAGVEQDFAAAMRWASVADALGLEDTLSVVTGAVAGTDDTSLAPADRRMFDAIGDDDVDAVRAAITDGANVETLDEMERTPLMVAAGEGKLEIVRALLDAGADPNHYCVRVIIVAALDTPLGRARDAKHRAVVKLLKERGAKEDKDLPDPHGLVVESTGTPHERLVEALWDENEDRVRNALAEGADPNGLAHGDEPVLGAAVRLRKPNYVTLLIEAGADPNMKDESGKPLLIDWIFDEGGVACVEALLAGGADPNVRYEGEDAAAKLPDDRELRVRMLRALLAAGLKVDRRDSDGYTLLARAVEHSDLESFELLLASGADPRVRVGKKKHTQTLLELAEYASGKGITKIRTRLVELNR